MNRRALLKSTAAVAVATLVPAAMKASPVLYGDGVHDDTGALQQWFDGENVLWVTGEQAGDLIEGRCFLITVTIDVTGSQRVSFSGNHIHCQSIDGPAFIWR